jgi:ribonuclease HI
MYKDAASILDIQPLHHIAFTDGSCYPNNKSATSVGGYAAVFVSGEFNDKCLYGNLDISVENASNIRTEGMAILRVLEVVRDCKTNWKKSTFDEKKNPDMTKKIWIAYNEAKGKGEIKLMHMRSHNKDKWGGFADGTFEKYCFEQNYYVDKLCSYARLNLKSTDECFEIVEY